MREKPVPLDIELARQGLALADTVSEIREVRHHYNAGVKDGPGLNTEKQSSVPRRLRLWQVATVM